LEAVTDGSNYLLTGNKVHVLDGSVAHKFIVVARTGGATGDRDGLSLFIVDRDADGLDVSSTLNLDNHLSTNIRFNSVRISSDRLLGEPGKAWSLLARALDIGAICSASELLGVAEESFERTISYLKERKQFGVLVGSFQALHHRAALLFSELALCKSVVLKALQGVDEDSTDLSQLASLAKIKCGKTAKLAVNEAVQMHGGIGMTDEFDIGFFMKRAAAARQDYGDEYYHSDRYAQLKGY